MSYVYEDPYRYRAAEPYYEDYADMGTGGLFGGGLGDGLFGALLPVVLQMVGGDLGLGGLGGLGGLTGSGYGFPAGASLAGLGSSYLGGGGYPDPDIGFGYDDPAYAMADPAYAADDAYAGGDGLESVIGSIFGGGLSDSLGASLLGDPLGGYDLDGAPLTLAGFDDPYGDADDGGLGSVLAGAGLLG